MSKMLNKIISKIEGDPAKRTPSMNSGTGTAKSDYDTVTGQDTMNNTTGAAAGGARGGLTTGAEPMEGVESTGGYAAGQESFSGEGGLGQHSFGHNPAAEDAVPGNLDAAAPNVHHTALHLGEKTHENVRHLETEEVLRQREKERHVHHIQHHVQPVLDREEREEQHHAREIPVTHIHEKHVSEPQDKEAYMALGQQHTDYVQHAPKERTVLDRGEVVNETVHHHVHNVIQPIIEKETLDKHRIHTTIPTHHVVHEAPVVHSSIAHEPLDRAAFLAQGGKLGENLTHENAGVLNDGEDCERTVDGPGEGLVKELGTSGLVGSGRP